MTNTLVVGVFLGVLLTGRQSDPYLGERERPSVGVGGVTPTSSSLPGNCG